jgi:hypothetical protein
MTRRAKLILTAVALVGGLAASAAMAGGNGNDSGRVIDVSSPYIVGAWKFSTDSSGSPTVDTEFKFINPTKLQLTLEYAFFDADGTFCGCDRDDFPPNKTTTYTMFQELNIGPAIPGRPPVFSCTGSAGALKSIVFLSGGGDIVLDDALQVGFQTHVFGVDPESDPSVAAGTNLQGRVMTEAGMQAISINDATRREIKDIHQQCVSVNGPLSGSGGSSDLHVRHHSN